MTEALSLPSYRYHLHDLDHLHLVVAEDADRRSETGRPHRFWRIARSRTGSAVANH
ncbi:hypothetical protein [Thiobacillus thioparus]|uniref:hypothetical protein n=1 Tax=Thiobacillus thioparus TaxID=931 RepID=UPI00037DFEFF|nr:hypothetical protein [Thiobacillus thioparus]